MGIFEYNVTNPYPLGKLLPTLTIIFILFTLPPLIIVNIITGGYELVPMLRENLSPNNTVPRWWNIPELPSWLHRSSPPCDMKPLGRGDIIQLTPKLFQYTIMSTWEVNETQREAFESNQKSIEYRNQSFSKCSVYSMGIDYNAIELTHTFTVGVWCNDTGKDPFALSMSTQMTFSYSIANDFVGKYYGYDTDATTFIQNATDYRSTVFAVLDVLLADADGIMSTSNELRPPILSLNTIIRGFDLGLPNSDLWFGATSVTFLNGSRYKEGNGSNRLGPVDIYRPTLVNIARAIQHAIELDLGNPSPGNIFTNKSTVNQTLDPNDPPPAFAASGTEWAFNAQSFFYGTLIPPYQTWAQMLRAGMPQNITLGEVTGLTPNSTLSSNYLCPAYRRKPNGAFLASVFIGTASMFLSAWEVWMSIAAFWAKRLRPRHPSDAEEKQDNATIRKPENDLPDIAEKGEQADTWEDIKESRKDSGYYQPAILTSREHNK